VAEPKPCAGARCASFGCPDLAEPGHAECAGHLQFTADWQRLVSKIPGDGPSLTVRFHEHLDACQQCREHPFALCPTGNAFLAEVGGGSR
jgi:hypothetical protein